VQRYVTYAGVVHVEIESFSWTLPIWQEGTAENLAQTVWLFAIQQAAVNGGEGDIMCPRRAGYWYIWLSKHTSILRLPTNTLRTGWPDTYYRRRNHAVPFMCTI